MKVSTDSIILGSWALRILGDLRLNELGSIRSLDIGSGSGLLSLMLAQGYSGGINIDAVELETAAHLQSVSNVANSPWPDTIKCHNDDIHQFSETLSCNYHLIISNPPYFPEIDENSRAHDGMQHSRTLARNQSSLQFEQLVALISKLLHRSGFAFVVIPVSEEASFRNILTENSLFVTHALHVQATASKEPYIVCLAITPQRNKELSTSLIIYDANNVYTNEYRALCKAFYLNF